MTVVTIRVSASAPTTPITSSKTGGISPEDVVMFGVEVIVTVLVDIPACDENGVEMCHYHKVQEYFVYRDDHGLGSMAIHLAHHCFSFNMRNLTALCDLAHQITPVTKK